MHAGGTGTSPRCGGDEVVGVRERVGDLRDRSGPYLLPALLPGLLRRMSLEPPLRRASDAVRPYVNMLAKGVRVPQLDFLAKRRR